GLRWADVNLDARTLTVRQTIQTLPKIGPIVKPPKTKTSRRPVAVGVDVIALLRRHKAAQNEKRLQLGDEWIVNDLVFPTGFGKPFEYSTVRDAFRRICKAAGVPTIRLRDLRHTAATLLLVAGINPKVVSERLGHSNITITLQTYSLVRKTMQEDAAEKMDGLLRQPERRQSKG
ncbi:MAG TPA: site-specific integrase, partial [Candidatus Solibacter sp.]|nr:site-specific integrase [Candidatus Solibacter sp.]